MKCAGSSVEKALYDFTGPDALCAGSASGAAKNGYDEYEPRNNNMPADLRSLAGQSTKKIFYQHTTPEVFDQSVVDNNPWADFTRVSISRNPLDSVISYYWWCIWLAKHREDLRDAWEGLLDYEILPSDSRGESRKKFETVLTTTTVYPDGESYPEAAMVGLCGIPTTPISFFALHMSKFADETITRYLRFERLQDDWDSFCCDFALTPKPLPRFKSRQRRLQLPMEYYYSPDMLELMNELFYDYINKFGYTFEKEGG